ncbi:MAG TPA: hypothetical protein VM694_16775 [Polyangium sp.]|nr:hypothetical protein [Polyangium sp.]
MIKLPEPGLYRTTKPYPGQEGDELVAKLVWAPILPVRKESGAREERS